MPHSDVMDYKDTEIAKWRCRADALEKIVRNVASGSVSGRNEAVEWVRLENNRINKIRQEREEYEQRTGRAWDDEE